MEREAFQKVRAAYSQREALEREGFIHPREAVSYESEPTNLHQAYQDLEREISSIKRSLKIEGTSTSS